MPCRHPCSTRRPPSWTNASVTIGSYNLDEGLRKNLEANVAVVDERFAAHVTRWFEHDLERARLVDQLGWQKRSLFLRGAERLALALYGLQ